MPDIERLIETVTGQKPNPERVRRIHAIAHAADIPAGDAMFPILVALDAYYGAITGVPERITNAARQTVGVLDKVTETAAKQAVAKVEDKIEGAVSALAPAVNDAVKDAAKGAVTSMMVELDLLNVIFGAIVAAVIFAAGVLEGAGILRVLMWGRVDLTEFTRQVGWGIGLGIAIAVTGLWSATAFASKRAEIWHGIAAIVAAVLAAIMFVGAANFAYTYRFSGEARPLAPKATGLSPLRYQPVGNSSSSGILI
jgi:hypothetical protein